MTFSSNDLSLPEGIAPEEVVVSCVFESKAPYADEAVLLYRTLDALGGTMAGARRRAYCAGPVEDGTRRALEGLAVEVVVVEGLIPEYPHANKIRMFEQRPGEKILVALDTDVCIAGDFGRWLSAEMAAIKQVDQNPLDDDQWKRLFGYFGLEVPRVRYLTHFDAAPVTAYFNTGVVVMPSSRCAELTEAWEEFTRVLWANYDTVGLGVRDKRFFSDQFGFALALEELAIPTRALPLEMNFPPHQDIHPLFDPDSISPLLIHHHHEVEAGRLRHCNHPGPNRAIDRVNAALAGQAADSRQSRIARSWGWRSSRRDSGVVSRRRS